jgi:hypothetical protein
MLDELKEFIDLNKCEQKFQWWVCLLIKVGLMAGAFTLLSLI